MPCLKKKKKIKEKKKIHSFTEQINVFSMPDPRPSLGYMNVSKNQTRSLLL